MINLIGVSGKKRSGKDTFFEILKEKYSEYENKKFAEKLKEVCSLVTGRRLDDFYDGTKYETYMPEWNLTIRQLQQKVGTEAFRQNVSEDTWVNALFSDFDSTKKWVITDVRFQNEADRIKKHGGILIRIERPETETDDSHLSEISLDKYDGWDHIIINKGTKDDYRKEIFGIF